MKHKGLCAKEVEESRRLHGENTLMRLKSKGFFRRFFENLGDPIIRILLAALALEVIFTFGRCNFIEIGGIVAAILIATVVSTVSELGSERAFAKMEAENSEGRVRVIRDGKIGEIPSSQLVVGDVVLVGRGEKIQADGVLIEGEMDVDQSALNGENLEAHKSSSGIVDMKELLSKSALFRGTVVTEGEGVMRVERVGGETYYGMVARDVQSETRQSPLKLRLSKLASQISKLGYVVAGVVGLTFLFNAFIADNGFVWSRIAESFRDVGFVFSTLIRALTLMITVVVVAVPEGLPMMITVVLSANMKRMMKDNILVKKLVGIETAGSLNILFSDKTGTITTGKLSVNAIISDKYTYKNIAALRRSEKLYSLLCLNAVYNSDAKRGDGEIVGGNATDRAIAEFFFDESVPVIGVTSRNPFSSEIKYSSVTLSDGTTLFKGAAEKLLPRCSFAMGDDGVRYASELSFAKAEYEAAVRRGERVIVIAEGAEGRDDLTFLALIILKDKLRKGVKEAVKDVLCAGIQLVMVTGDNKDTAVSIAEECGFFRYSAGHVALTSDELSSMSDDDVKAVMPKLRVVARALPQDKTRLVRLSQEMELVVGMTGDGINDAPSLKLADVGFAMGSGTDIAKSAGDIVIIDNSFFAISKTILYGRTIFKSIRKFITFQLIMNLAACGITLIGQFLGIDNPITIIQMLWVNIIMDTLGGLAFAGEAPISYYMKEKPKRRDEPIMSKSMLWHIIPNGIFTLGLLVLFLRLDIFAEFYGSVAKHLTAFYALFIFSGLFNCITARCERLWLLFGIGKNKLFIFTMLFISAIQMVIIYFGGSLFRSTPLSLAELGITILLGFSVIIFDSIRRIFCKLK